MESIWTVGGTVKYEIKSSILELNLQSGARINSLILDGVKTIHSTENTLGQGSYLLYPWVNRVRQYPKHQNLDGNNLPIHGLYTSKKRQAKILMQNPDFIVIQVRCCEYDLEFPQFTEYFTLKKNSLIVEFKMSSFGKFCFGYHPYFQFNDINLQNAQYETNICQQLQLDELMLPKYPFIQKITQVQPKKKYDTLFKGGNYFKITIPGSGFLKVTSYLPYWQIYTPDQNRIAIQPMSFCGNAFQIWEKGEIRPPISSGKWQVQVKRIN